MCPASDEQDRQGKLSRKLLRLLIVVALWVLTPGFLVLSPFVRLPYTLIGLWAAPCSLISWRGGCGSAYSKGMEPTFTSRPMYYSFVQERVFLPKTAPSHHQIDYLVERLRTLPLPDYWQAAARTRRARSPLFCAEDLTPCFCDCCAPISNLRKLLASPRPLLSPVLVQ